MPKVFISYSHDSPEHSERVLSLAWALRGNGIDVELDQFHGEEITDWPRWCNEQTSRECSDFVVCICTLEYRRRIEGKVLPEKGKGAYWEGGLLDDDIYDAKGNRRLIPILFDDEPDTSIPRFLRGWPFCRLHEFTLSDTGYEHLLRILTRQAKVEKNPLGPLPVLPTKAAPETASPTIVANRHGAAQPVRVYLSKLPPSGRNFLGREAELKLLDDAWADAGRTHVVVLVAPGGVGKTTLVKRWLDRLKSDGWRGAGCVYGWSFFSQGTSDDRQASDDAFLNDALRWFGVEHDPAHPPWDKGRLLAEAIARNRTLLVLDGLEPLQHPPGPQGGALRAPGVQALLRALAGAGQPGLCVVTTREAVGDLAEYERTADNPAGEVLSHDLGNLAKADGARLLHRLGVTRAGAAAIAKDDAELRAVSREVRGHALALTLLGGYLRLAHGGDIRQRDRVRLHDADAELAGGHAFKVMEGYERWFASAGQQGARALTAVRLLGLFDRPADATCLAAVRAEPAIAGLTDPLVAFSEAQWNITLQRLADCGLVYPAEGNSTVDAHPLVREYFGKQLREREPEAWREGHRRLYEHLEASVPYWPEKLAGLQPLYQAVAHGCQAGLHEQACEEVFIARIKRGPENYSTRQLGAVGADLGAVACYFEEPWQRLVPALSKSASAWLLNEAAICLAALGRLTEAHEPMRAGMEARENLEQHNEAAIGAINLSQLELTLGDVDYAAQDAAQAVGFADRSGEWEKRMFSRTALADALHQWGRRDEALKHYQEAEAIQAEYQRPHYLRLYATQGFAYCDLLLAGAERAAWATSLVSNPMVPSNRQAPGRAVTAVAEVEQRAVQTLEWAMRIKASLLAIALDYLTLGRAALYRAVLVKW
jgi:tetratricopeptide (TPR) repeat protein